METGRSVIDMYYKGSIQKVLRPAIRGKRPNLLAAGSIILHDNAAPHLWGLGVGEVGGEGEDVTSLAQQMGNVVLHPPYSPNLSPCDYDLFARLKENMRVVRTEVLEELEDAVAEQVRLYERGCPTTGIQKLLSRWRWVIWT